LAFKNLFGKRLGKFSGHLRQIGKNNLKKYVGKVGLELGIFGVGLIEVNLL
jgi:hypothetical protein